MESKENKFKILMFPWLAYSHVFPFHELAKRLSKRNFQIFFCSSPVNLDLIRNSTHNKDSSIELVQLQIPSLPELPPKFHTTKNLPPNLLPILLEAFQNSNSFFSEILENLKPDLLIYDFFQPWAPKMALLQGIPSVYFATSGAAPFSFFHHWHTYGNFSTFPYQELYLLDHEKAALGAITEPKIKDSDNQDFSFGVIKLSCDIVLVKSWKGVEGKYIDYLSTLCKKKIVPTGPLIQDSLNNNNKNENFSNIMKFLSEKNQFSTVFICFGSENLLSNEQIQEIAKMLELCEVNFIWAVRFPTNQSMANTFSSEFLEKVKERGILIEGWAPQAEILSHPSIGGFVSHCGWSSVMESLYFGVPIIALPLKFDQPINARLAVAGGVGVEVGRGSNGNFSREEVAKAINEVIMEKNCEDLRYRVRKLSEEMRRGEEEEVDEAANQLLELCIKNKQKLLESIPSSSS